MVSLPDNIGIFHIFFCQCATSQQLDINNTYKNILLSNPQQHPPRTINHTNPPLNTSHDNTYDFFPARYVPYQRSSASKRNLSTLLRARARKKYKRYPIFILKPRRASLAQDPPQSSRVIVEYFLTAII